MIAAFLRTLALTVAVPLLIVLIVFAAAQGALDGNPTTPGYWARYWPVWLASVPVVLAVAASVTGRAGSSLAWSGAALLLVAALVLARLAALG